MLAPPPWTAVLGQNAMSMPPSCAKPVFAVSSPLCRSGGDLCSTASGGPASIPQGQMPRQKALESPQPTTYHQALEHLANKQQCPELSSNTLFAKFRLPGARVTLVSQGSNGVVVKLTTSRDGTWAVKWIPGDLEHAFEAEVVAHGRVANHAHVVGLLFIAKSVTVPRKLPELAAVKFKYRGLGYPHEEQLGEAGTTWHVLGMPFISSPDLRHMLCGIRLYSRHREGLQPTHPDYELLSKPYDIVRVIQSLVKLVEETNINEWLVFSDLKPENLHVEVVTVGDQEELQLQVVDLGSVTKWRNGKKPERRGYGTVGYGCTDEQYEAVGSHALAVEDMHAVCLTVLEIVLGMDWKRGKSDLTAVRAQLLAEGADGPGAVLLAHSSGINLPYELRALLVALFSQDPVSWALAHQDGKPDHLGGRISAVLEQLLAAIAKGKDMKVSCFPSDAARAQVQGAELLQGMVVKSMRTQGLKEAADWSERFLNSRVASLSSQLVAERDAALGQAELLQASLRRAEAGLSEEKEQRAGLEGQLQARTLENAQLRASCCRLKVVEEQLGKHRGKATELRQEVADLRGQLDEMQASTADAAELQRIIQALTADNAQLHAANSDLQVKLAMETEGIAGLRAEVSKLRADKEHQVAGDPCSGSNAEISRGSSSSSDAEGSMDSGSSSDAEGSMGSDRCSGDEGSMGSDSAVHTDRASSDGHTSSGADSDVGLLPEDPPTSTSPARRMLSSQAEGEEEGAGLAGAAFRPDPVGSGSLSIGAEAPSGQEEEAGGSRSAGPAGTSSAPEAGALQVQSMAWPNLKLGITVSTKSKAAGAGAGRKPAGTREPAQAAKPAVRAQAPAKPQGSSKVPKGVKEPEQQTEQTQQYTLTACTRWAKISLSKAGPAQASTCEFDGDRDRATDVGEATLSPHHQPPLRQQQQWQGLDAGEGIREVSLDALPPHPEEPSVRRSTRTSHRTAPAALGDAAAAAAAAAVDVQRPSARPKARSGAADQAAAPPAEPPPQQQEHRRHLGSASKGGGLSFAFPPEPLLPVPSHLRESCKYNKQWVKLEASNGETPSLQMALPDTGAVMENPEVLTLLREPSADLFRAMASKGIDICRVLQQKLEAPFTDLVIGLPLFQKIAEQLPANSRERQLCQEAHNADICFWVRFSSTSKPPQPLVSYKRRQFGAHGARPQEVKHVKKQFHLWAHRSWPGYSVVAPLLTLSVLEDALKGLAKVDDFNVVWWSAGKAS